MPSGYVPKQSRPRTSQLLIRRSHLRIAGGNASVRLQRVTWMSGCISIAALAPVLCRSHLREQPHKLEMSTTLAP
jgi:hypothetical protein